MSSSSCPLEITLPAGKFLFSDQPLRVGTLLGSCVALCGLAADEARSVGRQNIDAGRRLLADNGFNICGEDLADSGYRKLAFDLSNGAVEVKHGVPGLCSPATCAMTLTLESVERQTHARCHRIKAVTTFVTEGESPCSGI